MSQSPWASLAASQPWSAPPIAPGTAPCAGCPAPCCWIVQLSQSVPGTLRELDFLRFCAGFEGIEIGITGAGNWCVNYRKPCRHLQADFRCELHGTPHKPLVCQRYDEHNCLYREAFLGPTRIGYLRVDLPRFDVLVGLLRFDADGQITHVPPRDEILRALLTTPAPAEPERRPLAPPREPPVVAWDAARARPEGRLPIVGQTDLPWTEASRSPCSGCAAPCCQVLVIDHGTPSNINSIDFMEYLLGFPGLELALTHQGWKILVRTTCRHFDREAATCSIWGRPERPLICGRYDAWSCAYKGWLMEPQTLPFVRVDHQTFQRVRRHIPLDESGQVTVDLTPEQLRAILAVVAPDALPATTWSTIAGGPP